MSVSAPIAFDSLLGSSVITNSAEPPPLSEHPSAGRCIACDGSADGPWYSKKFDGRWMHFPNNECRPCELARIDRILAKNAKVRTSVSPSGAIVKSLLDRWDESTPHDFRSPLDRSRLSQTLPESISSVLSYAPSDQKVNGLILVGPSRSGKTRVLYALGRILVQRDISVVLIPMDQFAMWSRKHASEGASAEADWALHLASVDVLILDDLGKGRLTPAAEDALFAVIRERHAYRRPILISTQEDRNTLGPKFRDPASAVAIIERLLETSTSIQFGSCQPNLPNQTR